MTWKLCSFISHMSRICRDSMSDENEFTITKFMYINFQFFLRCFSVIFRPRITSVFRIRNFGLTQSTDVDFFTYVSLLCASVHSCILDERNTDKCVRLPISFRLSKNIVLPRRDCCVRSVGMIADSSSSEKIVTLDEGSTTISEAKNVDLDERNNGRQPIGSSRRTKSIITQN